MKKQLKEKSRVQELLKDGLVINYYVSNDCLATNTDNWNPTVHYSYGLADLALLIKWFSAQGLKPKKIKEEIIKLWYNYDPLVDFDILNKMIRRVRNKKNYELIEIEHILVPKSALEWFKRLIGTVPDVCNDAWAGEKITVEHVKVMFTLWIWAKAQEQYKKYGITTIYMDNAQTKLKRESSVKQSVKMIDIIGLLFNAGYIDVPSGKLSRYIIKYWDDVPNDGEMLVMNEFSDVGKWFERECGLEHTKHIKRPVDDVCPVCGKEFVHKSHRHDELCSDCAKIRDREKDRLKKQRKRDRLKRENGKNDT